MITLKRLNVVRQVDTEERAAKLEALGFTRVKAEATKGDKPAQGKGDSKPPRDKGGGKPPKDKGGTAQDTGTDNGTQGGSQGSADQDGKEGQDGRTDQPGGGNGTE